MVCAISLQRMRNDTHFANTKVNSVSDAAFITAGNKYVVAS